VAVDALAGASPGRLPRDRFLAERMAHVAARDIAAQSKGERPASHRALAGIPAVCVTDAGSKGAIMLAGKALPLCNHGVLVPGPQAHAMKLAFGKCFLWKTGGGHAGLR